MEHSRIDLRMGWSMREAEGKEWLPVNKVPSQVHVDLLANKMYVHRTSCYCTAQSNPRANPTTLSKESPTHSSTLMNSPPNGSPPNPFSTASTSPFSQNPPPQPPSLQTSSSQASTPSPKQPSTAPPFSKPTTCTSATAST